MPYRVTADPIYEQRERLDAVVGSPHVAFATATPSSLRYKLHEALNAARVLAIEPYCHLHVTVRALANSVVVTWDVPFTQQEVSRPVLSTDVIQLPGRNEFEVIQAVLSHPEIPCFEFTGFTGDVESIRAWVDSSPDVTILTTNPLTIQRR